MRGAIIGLGNVAVHGHVPGWLDRPEVEIVAVSDVRSARRALSAARLPAARWFDAADSLLAATRLDFVDICTPPSSHSALIRAALERGVHVLCESGRIELHDDTLILIGTGGERRWACAPLSGGSHHPEWFGAVADGFLSEVASGAPTGRNLAEAGLCVMVEGLARESSRRGGAALEAPIVAVAGDLRCRAFENDLKIAGGGTVARAAGLLLIVPARGRTVAPHTPVAGLPLLRRIALAGSRAGLLPVLAGGLSDASLCAEGIAVELGAHGAAGSPRCRRIIVCPANVIVQTRWLRALAESSAEPETFSVDPSMVALVDTEDPGKVLGEAARASTADDLIAALGDRLGRRPASFDPFGRFWLAGTDDTARAEAWLLKSLVKDSEGFMSRHFERRISLAVTRRLVWTPITPNAMTLVSLVVGLGSAPFFLSARPAWQLLGALVFLTHSILDGCDGELARLKFLESPRGAMLDFWGDNVVHVTVFGCMAVGWSVATSSPLPLLLGVAAIGAVAVATAVLSGMGLQPRPPGSDATARVVDALANRDFIYLVLALSTVGRAWWFVAVVAMGTPIFVLAALWANRGRPRV